MMGIPILTSTPTQTGFVLPAKLDQPELLTPGRKPVGNVEINWAHPLTDNLSIAVFATEKGLEDIHQGLQAEVDTSLAKITTSGITRDYQGLYRTVYPNNDRYHAGSLGISVFAIMDTPSVFNSYGAIAACQLSTTTHGWEFRLGKDSGDSKILFHKADSNYRQFYASESSLLSTNSNGNKILVTSGPNIEDIPTFYVNDTSYTGIVGAGNTTGAIGSSATSKLFLGRRYDNGTRHFSGISVVFAWKRELTSAEAFSISANPYQFLKPVHA